MKVLTKAAIPVFLVTALCIPLDSYAYLGGFESSDGYDNGTGFPTIVNSYNAGQYGSANGNPGGSFTSTLPLYDHPSGLWDDLNNAYTTYHSDGLLGGYYATKHSSVPAFGIFPHSGNAMLALRNTTFDSIGVPGTPTGPLDFRYLLDMRDLYNDGNPVSPTNTGDKLVKWSIWVGPGPAFPANEGVWLTFRDSDDNAGFYFGWDERYQLRYRNRSSDPWTDTGYVFGRPWDFFTGQAVIYDRFDFSLDLLNDTWSFDVFSGVAGNIIHDLVPKMGFGQNLINFTEIDWHVSYGNEKSFFDDSAFVILPAQIPEPTTGALMVLGLLFLGIQIKNRRHGSSALDSR